jgi:hypothetical protein
VSSCGRLCSGEVAGRDAVGDQIPPGADRDTQRDHGRAVPREDALIRAGGLRAPGHRQVPQNSFGTSPSQASRAVTSRHIGCISSLTTARIRMAHQ